MLKRLKKERLPSLPSFSTGWWLARPLHTGFWEAIGIAMDPWRFILDPRDGIVDTGDYEQFHYMRYMTCLRRLSMSVMSAML